METHTMISEKIYYSLPGEVQSNLDLSVMIQGAVDPDLKFNDIIFHVYPLSYIKARWLLWKGAAYYRQGDYYRASYCLGLASHYMSDSFSAFHRIHAFDKKWHDQYEYQAVPLQGKTDFRDEGLFFSLTKGFIGGEFSWRYWIKNKNPEIVQNDLNAATSVSYSQIKRELGV